MLKLVTLVSQLCLVARRRYWWRIFLDLPLCGDIGAYLHGSVCSIVSRFNSISVEHPKLKGLNPFVLPNLEPKCAPGDPILYPESIFCHSP